MSDGKKVAYQDAMAQAQELVKSLGLHFERLEIAGSLRRRKAMVGDIELVGILSEEKRGLFGLVERKPISAVVDHMYAMGYRPLKAGDKYVQFAPSTSPVDKRGLNVDLFICTPENWGGILMIRTGSAAFSRKMMTRASLGGWCPDDMRFMDGRLWRDGVAIDVPEEEDLFREMGLAYVRPEERNL